MWALYRKSTQEVVRRNEQYPAGKTIPTDLDPDLAWLEQINTDPPVYDSNTHRLVVSYNVEINVEDPRTGTITKVWSTEPLSADELDNKNVDQIIKSVRPYIQGLVQKFKNNQSLTNQELYNALRFLYLLEYRELK